MMKLILAAFLAFGSLALVGQVPVGGSMWQQQNSLRMLFGVTGKPVVPTNQFIITIKTDNTSAGSTSATTFRFPTILAGTYNCTIDWGDGHTNTLTTWDGAGRERTYASAGTYTITVTGQFEGFRFGNTGDRLKLLTIEKFGTAFRFSNTTSIFLGCSNMNFSPTIDTPNLTGTTNFTQFFAACTAFNGNITNWDVSAVTTFNQAFAGASSFNQPIGGWNISSATSLTFMFSNATSFNQPIGGWNLGSVTNTSYMFNNASTFNQSISLWDMADVNTTAFMFNGAASFNQPIDLWNVSKVTSMTQMFLSATSFNQPLNSWVMPLCTNFSFMFASASSFNQNLSDWTFNSSASLMSMLVNCGMDCNNYSATLIGWAANPSTPAGRSLEATGRRYGTNAVAARSTLTTTLGWTITGDIAEAFSCP